MCVLENKCDEENRSQGGVEPTDAVKRDSTDRGPQPRRQHSISIRHGDKVKKLKIVCIAKNSPKMVRFWHPKGTPPHLVLSSSDHRQKTKRGVGRLICVHENNHTRVANQHSWRRPALAHCIHQTETHVGIGKQRGLTNLSRTEPQTRLLAQNIHQHERLYTPFPAGNICPHTERAPHKKHMK